MVNAAHKCRSYYSKAEQVHVTSRTVIPLAGSAVREAEVETRNIRLQLRYETAGGTAKGPRPVEGR